MTGPDDQIIEIDSAGEVVYFASPGFFELIQSGDHYALLIEGTGQKLELTAEGPISCRIEENELS